MLQPTGSIALPISIELTLLQQPACLLIPEQLPAIISVSIGLGTTMIFTAQFACIARTVAALRSAFNTEAV